MSPVQVQRPAGSVVTSEVPAPVPETVAEPPAPAPVPLVKSARPRRPMSAAKRWFLALSMGQKDDVKAYCEERAANPCAGLLDIKRGRADDDDGDAAAEPPTPEDKYLAGMSGEQRQSASTYCSELKNLPAPHCETPLVVAFDGQPVDFVPPAGERFAFVPGQPMATDWPTATTPWIALDRDGDGAITSGAELFGSATALAAGGTARNGFEALAALDADGNGSIDARDPAFARLVLWSDRDGDRRSTPAELRPLASAVTAISLAHTVDARCNARGDCEGERGTLRWRDRSGVEHEGAVVDVYLPRR